MVFPTNFDKTKKYPLAFLIHGGPQGAWADSWSTRWNPKVWADQGYVVVAPNPTGSTGFGQDLTDAIANNWGELYNQPFPFFSQPTFISLTTKQAAILTKTL